jgi:hypothetical protein
MGLQHTDDDEKLQFRTAANRAATARSGNDLQISSGFSRKR